MAVNKEAIAGPGPGEVADMAGDINIDSPSTTTVNHHGTKPASRLARLAIGAGLVASGAALPLGVATILDAIKPPPRGPAVAPNNLQVDKDYLLDLGE